jgi:hypothetical protein
VGVVDFGLVGRHFRVKAWRVRSISGS